MRGSGSASRIAASFPVRFVQPRLLQPSTSSRQMQPMFNTRLPALLVQPLRTWCPCPPWPSNTASRSCPARPRWGSTRHASWLSALYPTHTQAEVSRCSVQMRARLARDDSCPASLLILQVRASRPQDTLGNSAIGITAEHPPTRCPAPACQGSNVPAHSSMASCCAEARGSGVAAVDGRCLQRHPSRCAQQRRRVAVRQPHCYTR